jgi:ketosteroid isomerase-like protein
MSEDNLRIVLGGLELWNQGRFDEALELIHPDLEWRPGGVFPDLVGVYHGHEGLMRFWDEFSSVFETVSLEPRRRFAEGDEVVVEAHFEARGRDGVEVDMEVAQRYRMRDGKLALFEGYDRLEDALRAAGLDPAKFASGD